MPRRKSLLTVIRDLVREQVQEAVQGLLGAVGGLKKKAANGRRRRRRGRRGPGPPPGSKNKSGQPPGRGRDERLRATPGRCHGRRRYPLRGSGRRGGRVGGR